MTVFITLLVDELEGAEPEEEDIYDEPDLDQPDLEKTDKKDKTGNKIKIEDFEKRWSLKVRLIPNTLDTNYVYYDPNDNDTRRPSTQQTFCNIVTRQPNSTGSSSQVSSRSSSPTSSRPEEEADYGSDLSFEEEAEDDYGSDLGLSAGGKLC